MSHAAISIPDYLKEKYEDAKKLRQEIVWSTKNPEMLNVPAQEILEHCDSHKITGLFRYFVKDSFYDLDEKGEQKYVPPDIRTFSFEYAIRENVWRFTCSTGD